MDNYDSFYVGEWLVEPNLNRISFEQQEIILVPKVMSLLLLLVEHAGEPVGQQVILDHVWSEQVVSDSSIYQAIAQLRKAFGDSARQKHFIERVSGKGYRLIAPVKAKLIDNLQEANDERIAQPSDKAALLAQTNESISADYSLDSGANGSHKNTTLTTLSAVVIVSFIFVLSAYFFYSSIQSENDVVPSNKAPLTIEEISSIGLIKLTINQQNVSANFDALNDVLLTQLIHFKDIEVINLQSSVDQQNTQAILSGNISQQDDELRVYLKLEQTKNSQVVWAKQFSGRIDNLFALQDEIVANLLQLFNRQQAVGTFDKNNIDSVTFDSYLLARHLWDQRDVESLERSQQIFESLQENGRLFPLAAVGLCDTYHYLHIYSDWSLTTALNKCEPLLEQALAEQPNLGQALAAKALLLSQQGEKLAAERLFQKATALAPSYAFGYMWYSGLMRDLGQYQKSLELSQKAYQLAPMSPIINRSLAYAMLNLRKVSKAQYYYQRALELNPDYPDRAVGELDFYELNSVRAKAFVHWLATNQSKLTKQPNFLLTKAQIDLAVGDLAAAKVAINASEKIAVNPSFLLFIKLAVATAQADHDYALELLNEREKLHQSKGLFALTKVAVLSQMKSYQEAMDVLVQSYPDIAKADTQVTEQNVDLFVHYQFLQGHLPNQLGISAEQLSQMNLLLENTSNASLIQAEWYLSQGNIEHAQQVVLAMLNEGWLPDYNNELYPEARMKQIFIDTALGELKYHTLLRKNREAVIN